MGDKNNDSGQQTDCDHDFGFAYWDGPLLMEECGQCGLERNIPPEQCADRWHEAWPDDAPGPTANQIRSWEP